MVIMIFPFVVIWVARNRDNNFFAELRQSPSTEKEREDDQVLDAEPMEICMSYSVRP